MKEPNRERKNDIKLINAIQLNDEQKEAKRLIVENQVVIITGRAGSGKSLVCAQAALDFLKKKQISCIYNTRAAVEVLEYSGKAWQILLKRAEDALHLDKIDEAQSALAKRVDQEDGFMLLIKISNNTFDEIIYRSLLIIEKYRSVNNPMDPVIVKPISFMMKTEIDLINEINMLSDKNAPMAFLVETTKDLAKKRFSGNQSVARIVEILVSYDPIYNVSTKDKQILVQSGTIKKDDIIKSLFAYKTLVKLVSEKGTEYLETQLSDIFADLDAEIAPIVADYANQPVVII